MSEPRPQLLQTLDRGLTVLELVAERPAGLTVAELAEAIDVHRAVCYRLVSTLSVHGLVSRGSDGRVRLGAQVRALALRFQPQLLLAARPVLTRLADCTSMTAFLSLADGEECVAVEVVEPASSMLHAAYRVGSRHSIEMGAAGKAILSARPPAESDSEGVREARRRGYSLTHSELQPGAVGLSVPLLKVLGVEASLGLVTLGEVKAGPLARQVRAAAAELAEVINARAQA